MKTLNIFLFVLMFSVLSYSQELKFEDMIYLHKNRHNFDKCTIYLANYDYVYMETNYEYKVFSLDGIKGEKSKSFFTIDKNNVELMSPQKSTFDYYRQVTEDYKMELKNSGFYKDGSSWFDYTNDKYVIILTQVPISKNSSKYYYRIGLYIRE